MATQQKPTGRDYPLAPTPETPETPVPISYIKSKIKEAKDDGSIFKQKTYTNFFNGKIIQKTKTKSADGVVTKDKKVIGETSQYKDR